MLTRFQSSLIWVARLLLALAIILPFAAQPQRPASAAAYGDVVISEIMYDPATGGEENDEWVELYNPTTANIDLSNWVLTDDDTYPVISGEGQCAIPASTTILAGGFLIVSRAAIPVIANEVVCTPAGTYQLENIGDNLALFNASGEMIFGSLEFQYPDIAVTNAGYSIGLKNPTAGWSPNTTNPNVAYWAQEATAGSNPYFQHTAGTANNGWAGNITTPHTITLDGTVNTSGEWASGELLGAADNASYYVTWDHTDIFVGIIGGNTGSDKYNVLVDTDPFDTGSANAGTVGEYCGATFGVDGKPDYAIQVYPSGVSLSVANAGGTGWDSWMPTSGQTTGIRNGNVEFRIRKSDLGLTSADPVGLYVYACNSSDRVWAAWPPENEINTTSVFALTTRTVLDTTGPTRSPRDDAAHLGYETHPATSTGIVLFFDSGGTYSQNWHAHLNITTAGGTGCEVSMKIYANHLVSRLDGGARRSYEIEPNGNCTSLAATVSLKYEDGWDNNQAQTETDVNFTPSELRGLYEGSLVLYRYDGANWSAVDSNRSTAHNRVVTNAAVTQFSTWTFGYTNHTPTAITLNNLSAESGTQHIPTVLAAAFGLLALGSGTWALRRRSGQKDS